MSISAFKSHALQCINQVAKDHTGIVITKRGKPIAQVMPFFHQKNKNPMGKLSHTLIHEENIVSPLGDKEWHACQ